MLIEENPSPAFQSRWGYHPCTYDVYRKLKDLHRWYWFCVYDFHRWNRWQRKQPQNRVGSEPAFCPVFIEDTTWYKPCRRGDDTHYKVYPKKLVDRDIVGLFRRARTPSPGPVAVFEPVLLQSIDELHAEAGGWCR
ncbi:MAG: hypothetical protein AAGI37_07890 [Planctomycetota bacterium]